METITRKEAFVKERTRFYTGKPCKRGHDSERYVSNGQCCSCSKDAARKHQAQFRREK